MGEVCCETACDFTKDNKLTSCLGHLKAYLHVRFQGTISQ
jgi:hypothetical protein